MLITVSLRKALKYLILTLVSEELINFIKKRHLEPGFNIRLPLKLYKKSRKVLTLRYILTVKIQ